MSHNRISEERLNAFIDDELDAAEKSEVFEALSGDGSLSQQACELRQLSELVRHAYEKPPAIDTYRGAEPRRGGPWGRAAAASVVLALGVALGWVAHQQPEPAAAPEPAAKPRMTMPTPPKVAIPARAARSRAGSPPTGGAASGVGSSTPRPSSASSPTGADSPIPRGSK